MQEVRAQQAAKRTLNRLAISWALVVIIVLVLVLLALFVGLANSLPIFNTIDIAVLGWAYEQRSPGLTTLMAALTTIGAVGGLTAQTVLAGLAIGWRRRPGWRLDLALLLLAMGGVGLLNASLKDLYARLRPDAFPSPYDLSSFSFPSGHAMGSACLYGALAWLGLRRVSRPVWRALIGAAAALLIGGISFSRIYFAVHYPTDVVAGIVAGLAWLLFAAITVKLLLAGGRVIQRRPVEDGA